MKNLLKKSTISFLTNWGITLSALILATLLSSLFWRTGFPESNIVVTYILSVLMVARFTKGYGYGILASILGMFCFNFFFTAPYHTFNVYNKSYLVTFAVMLIASLLTSALTSKILRSSLEAKRREKQSNMLYRIASSLAKASTVSDVATISVQSLSNLLDCDVSCILADDAGRPNREYRLGRGERRVLVRSLTAGQEKLAIQENDILPIADTGHQYGLICLPKNRAMEEAGQEKLLSAISAQIFTAMDRERLSKEKERAKNEADREKFKSNLLRSISHDLRTPLTRISGSAEILLYTPADDEPHRLAKEIYDDASWLTRMVENILSLTKIQEGKLLVSKQPEAVEEIVAEAVNRASKYSDSRAIRIEIPDEVLFVPMDGKLIEQVLINLIDNSVKHTRPDGEIKVFARAEKGGVWFGVTDRGTGVPPEELPKIFNLFYKGSGPQADSRQGIGLGLPICQTIVTAHGGKILAENNQEGGLTVRFFLPAEEGTHEER